MKAEMVMIGTELLLGEIVDTNANRIARFLREIGMDLYYKTTVGDSEARLTEVLNIALDRSDAIITSGGLGPTVDDITRQCVANATGRKLIYSLDLEKQIRARFRSFGRKMADNNKRQAYIPEGATPLPNPVGTAPCFLSEDMRGRGFVISLPGVPRELEYMMRNTVIPLLVERMGGAKVVKVRILRTCAVGESSVDRGIGDLMTGSNPTVGLSVHAGQTDVRIAAKANNDGEADRLIAEMEATVRERLGVAIYGVEKESVAGVVGRLLSEKGFKISVIDTLTGGLTAGELAEAGFEALVFSELNPDSTADALKTLGRDSSFDFEASGSAAITATLARSVARKDVIGLALVGPFADNSTCIALHGPGDIRLDRPGRKYSNQENRYVRQWLATQALDWLRRALLGELKSPVDGIS
ncbi:MAG: CinA family nicotinamide mononucleotide deamidase-related protein [Deltaproteobacteria bacterium]|nr:CinA family nicotinamide mononucleotide deamidase-related protein [Deltaproteobacteria bacterium]